MYLFTICEIKNSSPSTATKEDHQPCWNAISAMKPSGSACQNSSLCALSGPDISVPACITVNPRLEFMVDVLAFPSGLQSPWVQEPCLYSGHSLLSFLICTPFWQLSDSSPTHTWQQCPPGTVLVNSEYLGNWPKLDQLVYFVKNEDLGEIGS